MGDLWGEDGLGIRPTDKHPFSEKPNIYPLIRALAESVLAGDEAAPGAFLDALQEQGGLDTAQAECREEVANILTDVADTIRSHSLLTELGPQYEAVMDCLQRYFPEAHRQLMELDE